ncbi:MAG: Transcriptional regulator, MerR family [uncultured Truepera sp.]|uniref:Transcriptional regulator, MerR family n=1 Tax=uncultured Truepera sp. TaxID=543023 RepID=A0A6J4VVG6_9DEIN|nr:MAG: Transcriptional regulator, MerR family [uncultured Truepera sp.]
MTRGRYTVNEVEERTKVPASTLRQWERRYGFPKPERSDSGYRLYCDGDIRSIEAMKRHIAEGVSASRAAELVGQKGAEALPNSLAGLQAALSDALLQLDESKADQVLGQAYSLYSVEAVHCELAQRVVARVETLWRQGEVAVTTERFARAYLQGRLQTVMRATANPVGGAPVVVACAPLEHHELGALILAVLLRRTGFRVLYLGADTPVRDLCVLARELRPGGVVISASSPESVACLMDARSYFSGLAAVVAFSGAAFNRHPELAESLSGVFLAADADGTVRRFGELVRRGALSA